MSRTGKAIAKSAPATATASIIPRTVNRTRGGRMADSGWEGCRVNRRHNSADALFRPGRVGVDRQPGVAGGALVLPRKPAEVFRLAAERLDDLPGRLDTSPSLLHQLHI